MASSVLVNPMSKNEHSVVTSQAVNSHTRLLKKMMPYIAERNTNINAKNVGLRSGCSVSGWWMPK